MARRVVSIALAVLSAALIAAAIPVGWADRVLLDTDAWVATVAPLAEDPAVREAVAEHTADSILATLDTEARAEEMLPGVLDDLAPLLAETVERTVRDRVDDVVASPAFPRIWRDLNREVHEGILGAIEGREGAVRVERGVFTLEARVLAEHVVEALRDTGVPLVGELPIDRVSGEVVLFRSPSLAAAGAVVDRIRGAATWLPVAGAIAGLLALAVARDRRLALLWWGVVLTAMCLAALASLDLGHASWLAATARLGFLPEEAAQELYRRLVADVRSAEQIGAAVGLLGWASGVLFGPSGLPAVATEPVAPSLGERVRAHRGALHAGGLIVGSGVLVALPLAAPVSTLVWVVAGVAAWSASVEAVRAATPGQAV